jgi:hypothetical protein
MDTDLSQYNLYVMRAGNLTNQFQKTKLSFITSTSGMGEMSLSYRRLLLCYF